MGRHLWDCPLLVAGDCRTVTTDDYPSTGWKYVGQP